MSDDLPRGIKELAMMSCADRAAFMSDPEKFYRWLSHSDNRDLQEMLLADIRKDLKNLKPGDPYKED